MSQKLKKALRLLAMAALLICAIFGIGLTGNFLNNNRERYLNNEIRTEITNKRDKEGESLDEIKE